MQGSELTAVTTLSASVSTSDTAGNTRSATDSLTYAVDTVLPAPTIALDNVTKDNIVNGVESAGTISLTSVVGGDFADSDTVTVTVNSTNYTSTVDGAGSFSIDVQGSDLTADTSIAFSVTTTDEAVNSATQADTHSYSVDTTAPAATVKVDAISADISSVFHGMT